MKAKPVEPIGKTIEYNARVPERAMPDAVLALAGPILLHLAPGELGNADGVLGPRYRLGVVDDLGKERRLLILAETRVFRQRVIVVGHDRDHAHPRASADRRSANADATKVQAE